MLAHPRFLILLLFFCCVVTHFPIPQRADLLSESKVEATTLQAVGFFQDMVTLTGVGSGTTLPRLQVETVDVFFQPEMLRCMTYTILCLLFLRALPCFDHFRSFSRSVKFLHHVVCFLWVGLPGVVSIQEDGCDDNGC